MEAPTEFRPIKGSAGGWWGDTEEGVKRLNQDDQADITSLLVGRRVSKVDGEHLLLDNGTVVKAIGHDGGCSCSAGCYDLAVLNGVDNVITRVEYDYQPADDYDHKKTGTHPDDPDDEWVGFYRIFVYAENERVNLMQFNGSDGNGYYGTGFEILVRKVS